MPQQKYDKFQILRYTVYFKYYEGESDDILGGSLFFSFLYFLFFFFHVTGIWFKHKNIKLVVVYN